MPGNYTFPGVYVEEIPSGVRPIVGVSTSNTAFVDFFARGPIDKAVRITGFEDFNRQFGGFDRRSEASYAIYQYFLNGGNIAWVVRVITSNAEPATRTLVSSTSGAAYGSGYGTGQFRDAFQVFAASPGLWGNNLQVAIDHKETQPEEFNLVVRQLVEINGQRQVLQSEIFRNLNPSEIGPTGLPNMRYAVNVINSESSLIRLQRLGVGGQPESNGEDVIGKPDDAIFLWLGSDGYWGKKDKSNPESKPEMNEAKPEWKGHVKFKPEASDGFVPGSPSWSASEGSFALLGQDSGKLAKNGGIYMLEKIAPDIFNILCIPAVANLSESSRKKVLAATARLCEVNRAFLIVDIPPNIKSPDDMTKYKSNSGELPGTNFAAVYYPRLNMADPLNENRPKDVGPSGTVAGIYARTDARRGVWKAPAGTEATLEGVDVIRTLTDLENGGLNPLGVNVLRNFPIYSNIVWGARTLQGADQQASEWKYVPVRRTALYIEESLYQGLKWVVFEPNDEPLWASIRLNVGAFMQNLFRQGAFQGKTPREAYFVKCDKETTTQTDINLGIVNIIVGFAPLKPAEFVIIKLQQMAGQIQT
jgi:uncharacterized protein